MPVSSDQNTVHALNVEDVTEDNTLDSLPGPSPPACCGVRSIVLRTQSSHEILPCKGIDEYGTSLTLLPKFDEVSAVSSCD